MSSAAISSDVATGLWMKGREGFIARPRSLAAVLAAPSALAALAALGGAARIGNLRLGAVPQAVAAVDDDDLARREALRDLPSLAPVLTVRSDTVLSSFST